jgi:hypothetical protein
LREQSRKGHCDHLGIALWFSERRSGTRARTF